MSIYTKTGDKGYTTLKKIQNISKTDDRIQLLGTMDELTSNIGLVKATITTKSIKTQLEYIQKNLMIIMSSIADQYNRQYVIMESQVKQLEEEINHLEDLFPRKKEFVLPGSNICSAQIDITRAVARRAERWLIQVDKKYNVDQNFKGYINRISDYLYLLARYSDYINDNKPNQNNNRCEGNYCMINNDTIHSALKNLGIGIQKIDLVTAEKLISKVEEHANIIGLNVVIAVCRPDGNPVAVHVMDGAYLASYDIALKKAYTCVALRMSTKELGELAKPGGNLYGIDKADNGRIIIFGGGVPLVQNNAIIGGLGVSGGTSEEDSALAEYGSSILYEIL